MYNQFFGFKENPFKLVPNPNYLYLSRSHEEALAHLNYAVKQGDGFVTVTGEVGTGKTTLCRVFLENLDERSALAYIFNPSLDAIQLLKAINDEFGISSDADTVKELIDELNAFLIDQKRNGRQPILLIDEAQNLSTEVLEQLRLLSNLETTSSKLIQIILVGQPELHHVLESYELRQLAQRITLSCHLFPLTLKETGYYIRHRLQIASHKSSVTFTSAAIRRVHRHSSGIPRLINICCDRSLLTAYTRNRRTVTVPIVKSAIKELSVTSTGIAPRSFYHLTALAALPLAVIVTALLAYWAFFKAPPQWAVGPQPAVHEKSIDPPQPSEPPPPPDPVIEIDPVATPLPPPDPVVEIDPLATPPPASESGSTRSETPADPEAPQIAGQPNRDSDETLIQHKNLRPLLQALDVRTSRYLAIKSAINQWNGRSVFNVYLEGIDDDLEFFRLAAKQNGLMMTRVDGDLDLLRQLNLPVILEFYLKGNLSPRFLTISGLTADEAVFCLENVEVAVPLFELGMYWTGVGYVLWKNFYNYDGIIPLNAPRDAVLTLKMHLKELGVTGIEIGPQYDEATREVIKQLQAKYGLAPDGVVGPRTKIILYNEDKRLIKPQLLEKPPETGGATG